MEGTWDFILALYYQMVTLPTEGYIASFLIINNLIIFVIILGLLLTIRIKAYSKSKKTKKLTPKLNSYYRKILCTCDNFSDKEIIEGYNSIIPKRTSFTTDLSITVLSKTKHCNDFNGKNFSKIIQLLSFDEFLFKKASFSNSITKYKTLNVIKELEIKSADLTFLPYAFSKNNAVRKEARLSHLLLSKNNPYRFFEEMKDDISHWDAIELIKLLEKVNSKGKLENLGRWLANSQNTSLTIFLIKAIKHFKQTEAKDVLIEKLNDKDAKIRTVVIETLGVLKVEEVEEILIRKFDNEVDMCQTAIIKALKNLDTGKSLAFLEKTFNKVSEQKLRTNIANTIFEYNKGGKTLFEKLKKSNDNSKKIILNHIETPLIKFKEYA